MVGYGWADPARWCVRLWRTERGREWGGGYKGCRCVRAFTVLESFKTDTYMYTYFVCNCLLSDSDENVRVG